MLLTRYEQEFPEVIACLKRARVSGRMAHAYLLHGDSPELRRNFSLVLSQIAICPNSSADGTPCGTCRVCRHMETGIYAEFYELMPTGKTWQIQVGERRNPEPNTVRWFESQFYLTSTSEASKKVGVIYDADRMNTESQNAFLKTLEEPPADSFFILATGNPSALPQPPVSPSNRSIERRRVIGFISGPRGQRYEDESLRKTLHVVCQNKK